MVIRLTSYVKKRRGVGVEKMLPLKKKHGDMQFSCVYFKENMSNNLLQENYSAIMSCFVIMVIRLTFYVRKKKGGGGGKNAAIKKKAR